MKLNNIILHCSDSEFGNVDTIRGWHKQRGWRDIGYHIVITNGTIKSTDDYREEFDGQVCMGRHFDDDDFIDESETGAHTLGYNNNSIGVCLIGTTMFTRKQTARLLELLLHLTQRHGISTKNILGHYETAQANGKTCPNIDMEQLRRVFSLYRDDQLQSVSLDTSPIECIF